MAQLVERPLLTPKVHGSNSAISKFYIEHLLTVDCIENMKIQEKEAGNSPFKITCFSDELSRLERQVSNSKDKWRYIDRSFLIEDTDTPT